MSTEAHDVDKARGWRLALAWAITAAVLVLTLMPASWVRALRGGTPGEGGISPLLFGYIPFDKFVHFTMFAAIAAAWLWAWPARWSSIGKAVAVVAALSVGTEVLQGLPFIGRDTGLADGLADLVGGLAATAVVGPIRIGLRGRGEGQSP